ncbi:MAG: hypothetical protein ACMUIL_10390 [bacterium]
MKSNALVRFVMVWWIALAMIVVSTPIAYGMNKADLVEKMAGDAGIVITPPSAYQSVGVLVANQGTWLNHPPIILENPTYNAVEAGATWSNIPPYNVLWPLWSPALSPADAAVYMEAPLVTDTSLVPLMVVPGINGDGVIGVIIMGPSMPGMDGSITDDVNFVTKEVLPWWAL